MVAKSRRLNNVPKNCLQYLVLYLQHPAKGIVVCLNYPRVLPPLCVWCGRPPEGGGDELRGWEASALSRIGLKYVRSRDDLAWYLGSLHTLDRRQWPTVIAGKHKGRTGGGKPRGRRGYRSDDHMQGTRRISLGLPS